MIPIELRWDALPAQPTEPVFQRVDEDHPLDLYLGRDVAGELTLLLVTSTKPPVSHQYRAIHVLTRLRRDGRWALMFRLSDPALRKVFSYLCEDLVAATRAVRDPGVGVATIMTRFAWWQRLFERGHTGILDIHALRGLVGELLCLEHLLLPERGAMSAVTAWVGPLGRDQDFALADRLFEVKAIRPGANSIRIASPEQLDAGPRPLELVLVVLDDVPPQSGSAVFDAVQLTSRLRHQLAGVAGAGELFDERLLAAGFIPRDEYHDFAFSHIGIRRFEVDTGFPRILCAAVPQGVARVSYEVQLDACKSFEISVS